MRISGMVVICTGLVLIAGAASAQVLRLSDAESDRISAGASAYSQALTLSTVTQSGGQAVSGITLGGAGATTSGGATFSAQATLTSASGSVFGRFTASGGP